MKRPTYANVVATLALFLAIGGTTVAGAAGLLNGKDVQDESLTGADVQNGSLTGADVRPGSLGSNALSVAARSNLRGAQGDKGDTGPKGDTGATGATGPMGAGAATVTFTGSDVVGMQDMAVLATVALPAAGDYVMFAHFDAHNTGTVDEGLNCGLFTDPNNAFGGGGTNVTAGSASAVTVVGAISTYGPQSITLRCQNPGNTTYDITGITIRTHDLGGGLR